MPNAVLFARALYALREAGVLNQPACKNAVKIFIQQSSADKYWNLSTDYQSNAAAEKIRGARLPTKHAYNTFCRNRLNGLTHEHMVPGEVVYKLLVSQKDPTVQTFLTVLRIARYRATITTSENALLTRSTVPSSFFDMTSNMYLNHRARYIQANIDQELVPRPEHGWFIPPMPFCLVAHNVEELLPLIYMWEIHDGNGLLIGRYVGKSNSGASRPLKDYARNVAKILANKPYRQDNPNGFRRIHCALAEAVRRKCHVTLQFICNVAPNENINDREQLHIRLQRCSGNETWQLNGARA